MVLSLKESLVILVATAQKEEELAEFLKAQDIPCLYNVDTRAVTRHIRS